MTEIRARQRPLREILGGDSLQELEPVPDHSPAEPTGEYGHERYAPRPRIVAAPPRDPDPVEPAPAEPEPQREDEREAAEAAPSLPAAPVDPLSPRIGKLMSHAAIASVKTVGEEFEKALKALESEDATVRREIEEWSARTNREAAELAEKLARIHDRHRNLADGMRKLMKEHAEP